MTDDATLRGWKQRALQAEGRVEALIAECERLESTLRDHFAARALTGLLSDLPPYCKGLEWKENTAEAAYQLADAMLAARKEQS